MIKLLCFIVIFLISRVEAFSQHYYYKMLYNTPNDTTPGDTVWTVSLPSGAEAPTWWRATIKNYSNDTNAIVSIYHISKSFKSAEETSKLTQIGLIPPKEDTIRIGFKLLSQNAYYIPSNIIYPNSPIDISLTIYNQIILAPNNLIDNSIEILIHYPSPDRLMFVLENTANIQCSIKLKGFN